MLRFEAIVHNTRTLHTGRALDKFGAIVARLAGMVDRFTTMLDCVDIGFLPDGLLDQLPTPPDRRRPRRRRRHQQTPHPEHARRRHRIGHRTRRLHRRRPRHPGPQPHRRRLHRPASRLRPPQTPRQTLVVKPGRGHRYQVPADAARTITALISLRDHVIAPVLAGVRKPVGRQPNSYTRIDRDYDTIRATRTLFTDLGITTRTRTAATSTTPSIEILRLP